MSADKLFALAISAFYEVAAAVFGCVSVWMFWTQHLWPIGLACLISSFALAVRSDVTRRLSR